MPIYAPVDLKKAVEKVVAHLQKTGKLLPLASERERELAVRSWIEAQAAARAAKLPVGKARPIPSLKKILAEEGTEGLFAQLRADFQRYEATRSLPAVKVPPQVEQRIADVTEGVAKARKVGAKLEPGLYERFWRGTNSLAARRPDIEVIAGRAEDQERITQGAYETMASNPNPIIRTALGQSAAAEVERFNSLWWQLNAKVIGAEAISEEERIAQEIARRFTGRPGPAGLPPEGVAPGRVVGFFSVSSVKPPAPPPRMPVVPIRRPPPPPPTPAAPGLVPVRPSGPARTAEEEADRILAEEFGGA